MDFGDLKDDLNIQSKITSLHNSIQKIDNILSLLNDPKIKDQLTLKEKTDYDLFMAYTLNTLYWIYLRTKGIDPNANEVKNQLNRVKDYMIKAKQVRFCRLSKQILHLLTELKAYERNTIRPTIKKDVAARFIKHGINRSREEEPIAKKAKTGC